MVSAFREGDFISMIFKGNAMVVLGCRADERVENPAI